MRQTKAIALVVAGLVAGLTLGSLGLAYAAPESTQSTSPVVACGAQVGQALKGAGARLIDILAKLTGLSTEEIAAKRADGQSIAQIAEGEGVAADDVVSEALAARKAVLDERVASGVMTQEQADAIYAQMSERLTERVSTTEAGRPSWAGGSGGRMGGGLGSCGVRGGGQAGTGACGGCVNGTTVTQ